MAHTGEGVGGNNRAGPFVCMVPGLPARSISWQVQMEKADPESPSHFSYRSSLNFQPGVKDGDSCSRKKKEPWRLTEPERQLAMGMHQWPCPVPLLPSCLHCTLLGRGGGGKTPPFVASSLSEEMVVVEWPLRGIKPPSAASSSSAARGICNGNEERGGEGREEKGRKKLQRRGEKGKKKARSPPFPFAVEFSE